MSSMHSILIAIGADRPGIVDEVSEFILKFGGNIEDSRMVNLHGQFAMMVLIAGTDAVFDRLATEVHRLKETGLHAELRPASASATRPAGAMPYLFRATGIDQSGVVHRIAHLLREMNVNIESLDTQLKPAPYTGAPMFEIEVVMAVPQKTQLGTLRQKLQSVCDELNVDWELEPVGGS